MTQKQSYWVTTGVMLVVGFLGGYLFREIAPNVGQLIPSSCTYEGKTYKHGQGFRVPDECNSCSCQNGQVSCTAIACGDNPIPPDTLPPTDIPSEVSVGITFPIGVVGTTNTDDMNLEKYPDYPVNTFPAAPVTVKYVVEHRSALNMKTVTVRAVVLSSYVPEPPCTDPEGRCPLGLRAPMIFLADSADPQRNTRYDIQLELDPPQDSRTQYPVGQTMNIRATVTGDRFYIGLKSLTQATVPQQ